MKTKAIALAASAGVLVLSASTWRAQVAHEDRPEPVRIVQEAPASSLAAPERPRPISAPSRRYVPAAPRDTQSSAALSGTLTTPPSAPADEEPTFRTREERERYYHGRAQYERAAADAMREVVAELDDFVIAQEEADDPPTDAPSDPYDSRAVETRARQLEQEAALHEQRATHYASLSR